jgi:hypothetical protein
MDAIDYLKIIQKKPLDQESVGIALGLAVKDPEVKPTDYERLCKTAQDSGFFFSNIQLAD